MSNSIPTFTLSSGYQIPGVGLGCWLGAMGGGERAYEMCKKAIKVGYRAFDTAAGYGNEHGVGRAIKESGIPRSEFFVTTKLQNTHHDRVAEALDASLTALGLDYVDLYLIHWPQAQRGDETWGHNAVLPEESPMVAETWSQMEALLDTGRVRSIGVSNFSIRTLETLLLPHARVTPAVNQIELHPFLPQFELKEYLDRKGIHVTAYSSLGTGVSSEGSGVPSLLQNGTVQSLADKHGVTTGQVLLSWGVQRGASVIPKSESEDRLRKNFTLVKLSDEDMQTLNGLHKQPGQHRSLLHYHDGGLVFGWTYEQLGWNFTTDRQVSE